MCQNRTELEQNSLSYLIWLGISKQNRVRTEQFELLDLVGRLETEQLEQNSLSYLIWLGVSKQNRVRKEQLEQNSLSYLIWLGVLKQNS